MGCTESYFREEAAKRWYEKDDGCYIHRDGSSWSISAPDGYGPRYDCYAPPNRRKRGCAGPPSTTEIEDSLLEGWKAAHEWRKSHWPVGEGCGGRAPVPTVRVVS